MPTDPKGLQKLAQERHKPVEISVDRLRRLDKAIIEAIKLPAQKAGTTVSCLTEDLCQQVLNEEDQAKTALSPLLRKYREVLKGRGIDERRDRVAFFRKKHG